MKQQSSQYAVVPELASFWSEAAPERPASQLQKGKRHAHDWQQWGDDAKFDRCTRCGAVRASDVKQEGLF